MRGSAAFRVSVAPGGGLAPSWVRDSLSRNAGASPSLDLRFADSKSLVNSSTGANLVTFTRASSGTYVGSDGLIKTAAVNEARFDHAITSSVTNLLLRSEEIGTSPWATNVSGSVAYTANAIAAPTGTVTADRVTATADFAGPNQFISAVSGLNYAFSFYIKAVTPGALDAIRMECFSGRFAQFNITTRVFSGVNAAITPSSVSVGDGWVRVQLLFTAPSTGSLAVAVYANTSSDFYLWGAQLEQSSTVGTYVPTTTAAATSATTESLGLLVEEQRTNLVLRSEAIATGPWFPGANTTLTNNTGEVLDPAGGSTATKVVVSGGVGAFGQPATLTATTYAGSIWLRCATGTISAQLIVYLGVSPFTNIGTTNVTITTTWQRFSVATSTATAASYNLQLNTIAVGTVYAWGAQLEAGSFPTSYIPTTTATVTRSADVASITGANFSSWYNQTEGTVFWNGVVIGQGTEPGLLGLINAGQTDFLRISRLFNLPRALIYSGNVSQADLFTVNELTLGQAGKFAVSMQTNNVNTCLNGQSIVSDTSVTMPVVDRMTIGTGAFLTQLNGTIRRLTYWPVRLSNNTLQSITR